MLQDVLKTRRIHHITGLANRDGLSSLAAAGVHSATVSQHRFASSVGRLQSLSPLAVLGRGYSLTFQADGATLVRSAGDVNPGDLIHTRLASGRLVSRVEERS